MPAVEAGHVGALGTGAVCPTVLAHPPPTTLRPSTPMRGWCPGRTQPAAWRLSLGRPPRGQHHHRHQRRRSRGGPQPCLKLQAGKGGAACAGVRDSMHEVAPPYLPPLRTAPLPPPNPPPTPPPYLPPPTFGSLRSTRGPAPAPPLNNMTPAVATDRLVCAPPFVCTALPVAP